MGARSPLYNGRLRRRHAAFLIPLSIYLAYYPRTGPDKAFPTPALVRAQFDWRCLFVCVLLLFILEGQFPLSKEALCRPDELPFGPQKEHRKLRLTRLRRQSPTEHLSPVDQSPSGLIASSMVGKASL